MLQSRSHQPQDTDQDTRDAERAGVGLVENKIWKLRILSAKSNTVTAPENTLQGRLFAD
jgi:hypothetical protein